MYFWFCSTCRPVFNLPFALPPLLMNSAVPLSNGLPASISAYWSLLQHPCLFETCLNTCASLHYLFAACLNSPASLQLDSPPPASLLNSLYSGSANLYWKALFPRIIYANPKQQATEPRVGKWHTEVYPECISNVHTPPVHLVKWQMEDVSIHVKEIDGKGDKG